MTTTLTVELPEDLANRMWELAQRLGLSVEDLARVAIAHRLQTPPLESSSESETRFYSSVFLASWDLVQRSYDDDIAYFPQLEPVTKLISHIRQAGFDRHLRAGTSLFHLIVSRSLYHGLRDDQPSIAFLFSPSGMSVEAELGEVMETLSYPSIQYTAAIELLLARLASMPLS